MNVGRRRERSEYLEMAKRLSVYAVIMFLLAIVQNSFLSRLNILPVTPCLVIGAVAVIAVIDSMETAAIGGIVGGLMTDALGGDGIYLSPLFFFITALLVAVFASKMMTAFPSFMALMPIACLTNGGLTLLRIFLLYGTVEWGHVALRVLLPEFICVFCFALPLYPLIRLCVLPMLRRGAIMKGVI